MEKHLMNLKVRFQLIFYIYSICFVMHPVLLHTIVRAMTLTHMNMKIIKIGN